MRLIDADVLLNNTDGLEHVKYSQEYGHVVLVCDIIYSPTVDAVEVVRCKDCKHYRDSFPYDICDVFDAMATDEDDFCSYGERKERSEDVGKSDTDDNGRTKGNNKE